MRMMKPEAEKIIFAMDVPDRHSAWELAKKLHFHVGMMKVGSELFIGAGHQVIHDLTELGIPIMLDLKLHDIPETVERSVKAAGALGVKFLTIHVQQRETLRRAVEAAGKSGMRLLCVTVLTSMQESDLEDLIQPDQCDPTYFDPVTRVLHLAQLAWKEGINGFVCSSREVEKIRSILPSALLVVPGVRPLGSEHGDQHRVGTPAEAVRAGADYLVIGRPIRDAADPAAVAASIGLEIRDATTHHVPA